MFGQNPVRKQQKGDGQRLWVQEVFPTIQGEGPMMGRPAIFIRLAGCNLRCWFCDTDFESSTWQPTLEDLMGAVSIAGECVRTNLIVITGGEPLRQNILPLCERLYSGGFVIQIETAGTLWIDGIEQYTNIVVSPKTGKVHPKIEEYAHAWKYIIRDGEYSIGGDGLPLRSTQIQDKHLALARPPVDIQRRDIFLQPMDERDEKQNQKNREAVARIAMEHGYRVSLQMHKQLGVE